MGSILPISVMIDHHINTPGHGQIVFSSRFVLLCQLIVLYTQSKDGTVVAKQRTGTEEEIDTY